MSRMTAEEVQNVVSSFVNNFNCDEKGFIDAVLRDHRTLQQSTVRLCFKVIEAFAELPSNMTDPRNESAARVSREVIDAFKKEHSDYKPSQYLRCI